MATLTPLKANGDRNVGGTGLRLYTRASGTWSAGSSQPSALWSYLDETITSSPADGDTGIGLAPGAQTTQTIQLNLTSVDTDFSSMDSLAISFSTVDYVGYSDDTGVLQCSIHKTDGTVLAEASTSGDVLLLKYHVNDWTGTSYFQSSDGTGTAPTYNDTNSFTLTSAGSSATESDWNAAYISIEFEDAKVKGSDGAAIVLVDFELTGTYTPLEPRAASLGYKQWAQPRRPLHVGALY